MATMCTKDVIEQLRQGETVYLWWISPDEYTELRLAAEKAGVPCHISADADLGFSAYRV